VASIPVHEELPPDPFAETEDEKVERWRQEQALKLGVLPLLAEQFARSRSSDLGQLRDLILRGCAPNLAARILL
jgi:hypothetical protein